MPSAATIDILPIFRTDAQWLTLTHLFVVLAPGEETTVPELARLYGLPVNTINDEVRRLLHAGLIRTRRIGKTRLLSANEDHPVATALRMLLAQTAGPLRELARLFEVEGVERIMIFGSWARRYLGEPGGFPRDVDVLVVIAGTADDERRLDVQLATESVGQDLHVTINPWIVTADEARHAATDSVLGDVLSGPLVEVTPPHEH